VHTLKYNNITTNILIRMDGRTSVRMFKVFIFDKILNNLAFVHINFFFFFTFIIFKLFLCSFNSSISYRHHQQQAY